MTQEIRVTPELAASLGLERLLRKQQEWHREHVQTGVVPGGVNRKGQIIMVPVFRKQWRKLKAQIRFVQAGKAARDGVYPQRHVLYGSK